jgi:Xaa-Pro aminopeptidase
MDRLTCLVITGTDGTHIVVPALEVPRAEASPLADADVEIVSWREEEDPFALVASLLPTRGVVAVDDRMWANMVLGLRDASPYLTIRSAGAILRDLRARKSPDEVAALREAAAAVDAVHAQMPKWLRAGRTERQVAADLRAAVVEVGHATADFVIVASGPNSASPHHEASERTIQRGDAVIVDIIGTMPSRYLSDETRTYFIGEPPTQYRELYTVLQKAQEEAFTAVMPGVSTQSIDAAARDVIAAAGYAEYFVHRTGHGIGLEAHEEPYILNGHPQMLEPGMVFSIEPGIYIPGVYGARIEDIVLCTESGAERLNHRPRDIAVLDSHLSNRQGDLPTANREPVGQSTFEERTGGTAV